VPPHRPGFWDAVEEELARTVSSPRPRDPSGSGEVVELSHPQPAARAVSPWVVASAAAAVVLVLGGATAILIRPAADPDAVATPDTSLNADLEADSLSGEVVTTVAQVARSAPWAGPRLLGSQVPDVLTAAWERAGNQRWCSALAPAATDLKRLAEGATVREAEFTGGWGIAWDRNEGAGQNTDGSDCLDCGRSAFGVAGTGSLHRPGTGENRHAAVTWSDGSFATIGGGGDEEGATYTSKRVARVVVDGQGCRYEVWSNLGEGHLFELIDSLRLVEGLDAAPVVLRTASDRPVVMAYGAPPWGEDAVDASLLDPVLLGKWDELGIATPQLVLTDLGDDLDGAKMRTWGSGVAWDKPNEPGHNNQNLPCAACGRGVAGIGWEPLSEDLSTSVPLPYRIEWEDGSYAEYGGRLADAALPRDRVLYFDPETGEETIDALQAIVHRPGSQVEVVVWTHLGQGHLMFLLEQLRVAESSK
jgi:hypothetical protein